MFSSKGIGEPPLTLAASVVCATRQAINSYRRQEGSMDDDWRLEIPMTSERIRMACQDDIVSFVKKSTSETKEDTLNLFK